MPSLLFATHAVAGFNRPHADRNLAGAPFAVATSAGGRPRHAVRARTNADGEAGVLFLPSRTGGDRYRIATFLETDHRVRAETGTLVVWRSVRLSRYLRKEAAPGVWPPILEEAAQAYLGWPDHTEEQYFRSLHLADDAGNFVGLSALPISGLEEMFACAYCEFESDADPEEIPGPEFARALAVAGEDGKRGASELGWDLDVDALLHQNWADPQFPNENSVVLVPARTPEAYNARFADGDPRRFFFEDGELHPDDREDAEMVLDDYVMAGFLRALSHNGALPGLTLIHGPCASSWQVFRLAHGWAGRAFEYRGCFVVLGAAYYEHRFLRTASHELGRTLFRQHSPAHDEDMPNPGGAAANEHDPAPADGGNESVMSYCREDEGYCSRCLPAFRGWDIER